MITKYLTELLYDNECVVVPNFGAFITKNHSAVIDYANNRFMPPYKEIIFNNKLVADDNVLVSHVSKKERISSEEAAKMVQSFVNKCYAILDHKAELELQDLGTLRITFTGEFTFEMAEGKNLLGDSFFLSDFNVQPIFRSETYQLIKEHIVVEQKEKNTPINSSSVDTTKTRKTDYKFRRSIFYVAAVLALFFVINFTTDRSDSNMASWNPFLYSSPNEFIISILGSEEAQNETLALNDAEPMTVEEQIVPEPTTETIVEAEIETVIETEVVAEATVTEEVATEEVVKVEETVVLEMPIMAEPEPIVEEKEIVVEKHHYFIIGGSFQTQNSAERCLQILKNQGFEQASVLEMNDKGNIRVSYESFVKKADALIRLDEIKKNYNESAWLLFQK